jgi:Secretion system C-terminal sorting domain
MKKITTFFALALSITAMNAQSVRWAVGSNVDTDYGYSFHSSTGNTAIIAGKTTSFPAFPDSTLYADAMLSKVDILTGAVSWTKTYRLNTPNPGVYNDRYDKSDIFWRTRVTLADYGSISVGLSADTTSLPSFGLLIAKTDVNGAVQWSKVITALGFANAAYDVRVVADGYVLSGAIQGATGAGIEMAIAKFDFNGDVVWSKTVGTTATQSCRAMTGTADGGFMLAGAHVPGNTASSEILVAKTNANGTVQWAKTYGGVDEDRATSICTDGTNFYVGGFYKNGSGAGAEDMFVMAIDATGNVLWKQIFGTANTDYVNGIHVFGSNLVLSGYYTVSGNDKNAVLIEMNKTTGVLTQMRQFGGTGEDQFYDVELPVNASNIMVVGNTAQIDNNNDMMVNYFSPISSNNCNGNALTMINTQPIPFASAAITLTTNLAGTVRDYPLVATTVVMNSTSLCTVGTENTETQLAAKVFPNPTSGAFNIELAENAIFTMTDVLGKTLKRQTINAGTTNIATDDLANGVYFVTIKNNENAKFVTKIVLNR